MKTNFVKQRYHSSLINENLERISLLNRIDLITEKDTRQKSRHNTSRNYIDPISTKNDQNH